MTYSKEQLIEALYNEYVFLCHDDFDPDVDDTPEEYRLKLECYSMEDLVLETSTDEHFTLDQFIRTWS